MYIFFLIYVCMDIYIYIYIYIYIFVLFILGPLLVIILNARYIFPDYNFEVPTLKFVFVRHVFRV